jgi:recombination protein RecR
MNLPSKALELAVDQLSSLPGIGKRTALRLTLNLLKRSPEELHLFTHAISSLKENTFSCSTCGNISDEVICFICANPVRDVSQICIVEDIRDIMAIESTGAYKGVYHVLGGLISPMDGIGPQDLNIPPLQERILKNEVKEVIFALSPTMEGDTTNFYLYKKIHRNELLVTSLSRGVAIGSELQYADELTLGRSMEQRQAFKLSF